MATQGLDDLVRSLPLIMTAAVLALLVALLLRARRLGQQRRQDHNRSTRAAVSDALSVPPEREGALHPTRRAASDLPEVGARQAHAPTQFPSTDATATPTAPVRAEPLQPNRPATAEAATAGPVEAPPLRRTADQIRTDLVRAEGADRTHMIADLHLKLGEALIGLGDPAAAAAELRKAIVSASRLRQHGTHASARLHLGDLAERQGDLTTACEHWQIARSLFQELAVRDRLAEAEHRMRRIGCPTDWVLNDF